MKKNNITTNHHHYPCHILMGNHPQGHLSLHKSCHELNHSQSLDLGHNSLLTLKAICNRLGAPILLQILVCIL